MSDSFQIDFIRGLFFAQDSVPLPSNAPDAARAGFDHGRAIIDHATAGKTLDPGESAHYTNGWHTCTGADARIAGAPLDTLTAEFERSGWLNEAGSIAYREGTAFDEAREQAWQHGWIDARDIAENMAALDSFGATKH